MINRTQIKDKISTGKDKLIIPNSKIVSDFENYDNDRETVQVEVQTKKYDRIEAQLRLMYELAEGRKS